MRSFLVEAYAPATTVVAELHQAARQAALSSTLAGVAVHHVTTILVRDDETCFHVFDADSVEAVRSAAERGAIPAHRIVPAEAR